MSINWDLRFGTFVIAKSDKVLARVGSNTIVLPKMWRYQILVHLRSFLVVVTFYAKTMTIPTLRSYLHVSNFNQWELTLRLHRNDDIFDARFQNDHAHSNTARTIGIICHIWKLELMHRIEGMRSKWGFDKLWSDRPFDCGVITGNAKYQSMSSVVFLLISQIRWWLRYKDESYLEINLRFIEQSCRPCCGFW